MKKIILFIFIIIFINYNIEVLQANTEKPAKVSVKTVKKEYISETYIVTSRIAPFKSDTIAVKSPGPIEWVAVEVGDFVKKGNVLLKIENDEFKTLELLEEIIGDIKNHELEIRIEKLESKFSKDLDENTFNKIRELKKSQKIN